MSLVKNAKIAVLIPTYMPGDYIEGCLDSLSSQSIPKKNFCVYIALNGVIEPYKKNLEKLLLNVDFNYQLFTFQKPGVSSARNFLIENTSEPYICFVDDDDVLSINYLEALLSVSSSSCMGICDVRIFKANIDGNKRNYIGKAYGVMNEIETSLFRARKYFSSACGKILHRKIIADTRFDDKLPKGEDALFMASLSPRVRFVKKSVPEACYYVYERTDSASRKKVATINELRRVKYLVYSYMKLFFDSKYNKVFIVSRIVATLFQLKKLF